MQWLQSTNAVKCSACLTHASKGFRTELACPCHWLCCAGALRTLPPSKWEELNRTVAEAAKTNKEFTTTKGNTAVAPAELLKSVNDSIALFQDNSVFSLGDNYVYPGAKACTPLDTASIKAGEKAPCVSPPIVQGY